MPVLGDAVSEEPGGQPGTPTGVSDEPGRLACGEEQQEEPHDLHRPDRQCVEVVDIGGAGDANGHGEPGNERVVREVPEKG